MNLRKQRILLIGVIGLLICGLVLRRGITRSVPGIPTATRPGTSSASLDVGGRFRTYLVHVPPQLDVKTPVPLVFVLHGATQSAGSAEKMSGMSAKADQERFVAVYPSGTGLLSQVPTWNAGNCCGYALRNHVDDIGFFRALIGKLERDYAVDRKRIYLTGISNGAMMSYRVACEMAGQVAAIAPVAGALNVDCQPSEPVSVLIFHGTADRLVPFHGGTTPFQAGDKRNDNSVANAVGFWVKHDGCSAVPKHEEAAEFYSDAYSGCRSGARVALYAIRGGRHMWPGDPLGGNTVPATDLIWAFFAAHPKP
ncbi:MAG: alpha/beta hydrolase family esterase [Bryobacteraceae bacterium]